MHKVANKVKSYTTIPLIHIAEVRADELLKNSIKTVGLLGMKYTMKQDFYKGRLIDRCLKVIIPKANDVDLINRVIFDELCKGELRRFSQGNSAESSDNSKAREKRQSSWLIQKSVF